MDWTFFIILAVVIAAVFALKAISFVSAETARQYLQQGALVVDVRSEEEYRGRHLASAVNIPLGELREHLPRHVKDKNQVLLLHCLSGGRSGLAKRQLKRMGYPNVFNLGSYGRAEKIVSPGTTQTGR